MKNCRKCGKSTENYLYFNGLIYCCNCYLDVTFNNNYDKKDYILHDRYKRK